MLHSTGIDVGSRPRREVHIIDTGEQADCPTCSTKRSSSCCGVEAEISVTRIVKRIRREGVTSHRQIERVIQKVVGVPTCIAVEERRRIDATGTTETC
jgi:hypothetical protein